MNNVEKVHLLAQSISGLYARKNADYGDSFSRSVEKYGPIAALTRMSDKFNRVETLIINKNQAQVKTESINDTLIDLATYSLMTIVALSSDRDIETLLKDMGIVKLNEEN